MHRLLLLLAPNSSQTQLCSWPSPVTIRTWMSCANRIDLFSSCINLWAGVESHYSAVLVSAAPRSGPATRTHAVPPSWRPHPTPLGLQRAGAERPLQYGRLPLAVCFMHDSAGTSVPICQCLPPASSAPCPHVLSSSWTIRPNLCIILSPLTPRSVIPRIQ